MTHWAPQSSLVTGCFKSSGTTLADIAFFELGKGAQHLEDGGPSCALTPMNSVRLRKVFPWCFSDSGKRSRLREGQLVQFLDHEHIAGFQTCDQREQLRSTSDAAAFSLHDVLDVGTLEHRELSREVLRCC